MAKGTTMIELECRDGRKSFSITHADNILRMKFHASWHLPEDSEWSWTAEKGFEKKAGKGKGSNGSNGSNGANGQAAE